MNRASRETLSSLRGTQSQAFSSNNFKSFGGGESRDSMVVERDENEIDRDGSGSDSRKSRKIDCGGGVEEADSALPPDSGCSFILFCLTNEGRDFTLSDNP